MFSTISRDPACPVKPIEREAFNVRSAPGPEASILPFMNEGQRFLAERAELEQSHLLKYKTLSWRVRPVTASTRAPQHLD